jgi:hypothetical protein
MNRAQAEATRAQTIVVLEVLLNELKEGAGVRQSMTTFTGFRTRPLPSHG